MDNRWQTIVITAPEPQPCEAETITRLLREGAATLVHIRKPGRPVEEVRELLRAIPAALHPQLRLHDSFGLLEEFPLVGGVHVGSRNPVAPMEARGVSVSAHTPQEALAAALCADYLTISPVYDSISKPGYRAAIDFADIVEANRLGRVIALGGVTPERFYELKKAGFSGAALLGYVWSDPEPAIVRLRKATELMRNFSLQFITNAEDAEGTAAQAHEVLAGGCRWVQIRLKDAPEAEAARAIETVLPMCRATGATLLVDDRVKLAAHYGIGVHLGKNDMPPAEARAILGEGAIIGATCNTAADIETVNAVGSADYIGLGPFRFTGTKKNLAPLLGLEGYRRLTPLSKVPVVAIGGIEKADVGAILKAGADGVAVSGTIIRAADPVGATAQLIEEINKTTKL